jgi:hypothetical protein
MTILGLYLAVAVIGLVGIVLSDGWDEARKTESRAFCSVAAVLAALAWPILVPAVMVARWIDR